jgi:hypothetical protein
MTACGIEVALTAKRHEFDRLRFKRRDRPIKLALGLLTAKIANSIEIGARKQAVNQIRI